jgi:hypothetical protein
MQAGNGGPLRELSAVKKANRVRPRAAVTIKRDRSSQERLMQLTTRAACNHYDGAMGAAHGSDCPESTSKEHPC